MLLVGTVVTVQTSKPVWLQDVEKVRFGQREYFKELVSCFQQCLSITIREEESCEIKNKASPPSEGRKEEKKGERGEGGKEERERRRKEGERRGRRRNASTAVNPDTQLQSAFPKTTTGERKNRRSCVFRCHMNPDDTSGLCPHVTTVTHI